MDFNACFGDNIITRDACLALNVDSFTLVYVVGLVAIAFIARAMAR